MVYVVNLVETLITCAIHTAAAGNTYLVSDGEAISTPNLLRGLAKALEFHLVCLLGLLACLGWLVLYLVRPINWSV